MGWVGQLSHTHTEMESEHRAGEKKCKVLGDSSAYKTDCTVDVYIPDEAA